MHRRLSQYDPERSWEKDFESEPEERSAADLALSGFPPEPVTHEARQHPSEITAREQGTPREPAALEPDPFPLPRDDAVGPIRIVFTAAALETDPLPPDPLSRDVGSLPSELIELDPDGLETLRFDEHDSQHPPELEHRPRAVPFAPPVDDTPWIGRAARTLLVAGVLLVLAFGVIWVLERDVRPPASAPTPPSRESADAERQTPPAVAAEPPVAPPIPDQTAPRDAVARPSQTVEQPAPRPVEPPPLQRATVPPPARPRPSERAPSPALPPLVRATPPASRGEGAAPPVPTRGTAAESTPPSARGTAVGSTPPPPTRGTAVESMPPPPARPTPPDPSPDSPARVAVDEPSLTPPASPPSQPLTAPPSAAPDPSATAASAPAAVDVESSAIREVLGRYRSAFNSLDARAARQVWPTVNPRTLDRAFGQLREQNVSFDKCTIDVKEFIAAASCNGSTRFVPRVGNQSAQTQSRQWNFILRKASSGGWQIQEVQAR
jgi:hypothetical protein